jgi:hypothetical protein
MYYYTFSSLLASVGAALLVGGLATAFGNDSPGGLIAGAGAFLLTHGLLAMKLAKAAQEKESKKQE